MSAGEKDQGAVNLEARMKFLARYEPFKELEHDDLAPIASSVVERFTPAGEKVLIQNGPPGAYLYVVRDGSLELVHDEEVVDILSSGQLFGYPTLLTGQSPEFTIRARRDSFLYCIPQPTALRLLSQPAGVTFVARSLHDRLIQAARSIRTLPDARARSVGSLIRRDPVFCAPDTPIRDAARLMADEHLSALLVRTRGGLGIVTDVDLRDKVVAAGASRDAPVSSVMSTPVTTVRSDALAPEAGIAMMEAGVNHLPVVDPLGHVVGVVSAGSLMALDALSPFTLRRSIQSAPSEDHLFALASDLPSVFVDLFDARVDASALTRIVTLMSDTMTSRLLELAFQRHGAPPTAFAWLALGSAARSELTLASDQDNGLAYADTDHPGVDDYFRRVAEEVNNGLRRCGFKTDSHGVLARSKEWRMPLSEWCRVFTNCLAGQDVYRVVRASIAFDFRQVAGDLAIVTPLTEIMRTAPENWRFLNSLASLGMRTHSPLGFRQRLADRVDIKRSGLLPIQNMARYHALANRIVVSGTLERLLAVEELGLHTSEPERSLREAFSSLAHVQLHHHAEAVRAGRSLDNIVDTKTLRPLTRVGLQEALRVVASARRRLPVPHDASSYI
jgi:CBS domain-containing protein